MHTAHTVDEMTICKLEDLSDEVLIIILRNLDKNDLIQCGYVSKRFRDISYDQTLWQKVNFRYQSVSVGFLNFVLNNGCKNICLAEAKMFVLQKQKLKGPLSLNKVIALKYLDLSWSKINKNILETLLESCFSLQELSMGNLTLSSQMISSICHQNGQSLRLLDLRLCWGLNLNSIQLISEKCTQLNEINLDKTNLSEDAIKILLNNLTAKIEKISLWGVFSVRDEHITTLVQRCNKLLVLNLQGTSITNTSITNIIENLRFN
jgi:hypothetical protein